MKHIHEEFIIHGDKVVVDSTASEGILGVECQPADKPWHSMLVDNHKGPKDAAKRVYEFYYMGKPIVR